MAHTGNDRKRTTARPTARPTARSIARRSLRREAPSTVALLADERDFAAMRRYGTFSFDDHTVYLRQMEGLLKTLAAQGVHITVALFDPVGYEEFCAHTRLAPDDPASRTRYTAHLGAAGGTVPYEGQPIDRLLPHLVDAAERQATWEYATRLLSQANRCGAGGCGEDRADAAFARASHALRLLLDTAGDGAHHLVCSIPADQPAHEPPLVAMLRAEPRPGGVLHVPQAQALLFCTVLAAGLATARRGGVVLRTTTPDGHDRVSGWALHDDWLRPLSEAEIFAAYCTDADTGEPVPPEHGVEYAAGATLVRPSETGESGETI
ncbi:hypothetical protein ACFU99_17535 [Streptomyces sp. NPDC057654]|uniref:hypothetical protein n=1 Tax=Streptomyces sp. NPDC057654 TaxID=3346196 RepID=UPI0036C17CC7